MNLKCAKCGVEFMVDEMSSHAWLHQILDEGLVPFENKGPDSRGYHMLLPIPPFRYPLGVENGQDAKLDRQGNIFTADGKKVGVIVKSFRGDKPF